jgi:hypothetical protein
MHLTRLLLGLSLVGCAGSGTNPEGLSAHEVQGTWTFSRSASSGCVPRSITVVIDQVQVTPSNTRVLALYGQWSASSGEGSGTREGLGHVERATAFFDLSLSGAMRLSGSMRSNGVASATAQCGAGQSAPMQGRRS